MNSYVFETPTSLKVNLQYPLGSLYPTILPFIATPSSVTTKPNLLATAFIFHSSNIVNYFRTMNH
jgi:hypothetical protein